MKSVRMLNGYRVVYLPEHTSSMASANWLGYVYEHIVVAEKFLGRKLCKDEVVHHLDMDRANNRVENLLVLLSSQHTKLHAWLRRINKKRSKLTLCKGCGSLLTTHDQTKFCSNSCHTFSARRAVRPTLDELQKELSTSTLAVVGKKYSVSGNAIRKWLKAYVV